MEFQGIYLSYIWTVIYTTKASSMQKIIFRSSKTVGNHLAMLVKTSQCPLLNLDHDFWRSFEKTKQQKVKIRKCGAIVAKVCGKEVAGFFWDGLLREIPNVNKNHRRQCTRRTLCCIKYREDKCQKNYKFTGNLGSFYSSNKHAVHKHTIQRVSFFCIIALLSFSKYVVGGSFCKGKDHECKEIGG